MGKLQEAFARVHIRVPCAHILHLHALACALVVGLPTVSRGGLGRFGTAPITVGGVDRTMLFAKG